MPIELSTHHLTFMNIGERYWPACVEDFTPEQKSLVGFYADAMQTYVLEGMGMFLWGDNNVGKSYIAAALCKAIWGRARVASYCVPASALKEAWTEFGSAVPADATGSESMVERVERVRFLVIDDLGKEHRGSSGFAENKFSALLRSRSRSKKTTLITANMNPKEFGEIYGRSMGQLAKECMLPVQLQGKDMRERSR